MQRTIRLLIAVELGSFGILAASAGGFGWLLAGPVAGLSSAGLVIGAAGLYITREATLGAGETEEGGDA